MRFSLKSILALVSIASLGSIVARAYLDAMPLKLTPYTKVARDSALSAGRCVVVTIYANWDSNTVDRLNLLSRDVTKRIRGKDMLAMDADWTQNSASTSVLMQELGISTVPALVFYNPKAPKNPTVILDIPSEIDVLNAIEASCK